MLSFRTRTWPRTRRTSRQRKSRWRGNALSPFRFPSRYARYPCEIRLRTSKPQTSWHTRGSPRWSSWT